MATEVIRTASEGRPLAVVGDLYTILVDGRETNGSVCVMESLIPPGGGTPPHAHTREDEVFRILEGEVTFEVEGRTVVAKPGTTVFAPRGQRHRYFNASGAPARMLITIVPAGLERMFEEVSLPVAPGATAAPPATEAHIAAVMAACPRYGVTVFPPGS